MTRTGNRPPPWMKKADVMAAIARKRLREQGKLPERQPGKTEQERFTERYSTDLISFCERVLGMTPWKGMNGKPGQYEILEAIQDSVRRQLAGEENVPFIFVIEAAHGLGKTYGIGAPVIIWFYRVFAQAVIQSTANTNGQVRDTLWKNIRMHADNARERRRNVMPGLLPRDMRAETSADHFAMGFVTNDAGGTGTERVQGQHNDFHLWVFEEAEGIPEFMFDAVKRQLTGNTVRIWLAYANPKTSTSSFQELKLHPMAKVVRLSLRDFPNVVLGKPIVPGGTTRNTFNDWIEDQRTFGCEVVQEHDETRHTFTVDWPVPKAGGGVHPPGTIFAPKRGFLYGALGVPPSGGGGDTFISAGRFDACLTREVTPVPLHKFGQLPDTQPHPYWRVQIGVDCSRFGDDSGTVYSYFKRVLRFEDAIQGAQELDEISRTSRYVQSVMTALRKFAAQGATAATVRVDAGYGGGIVDKLREQQALHDLYPDGFTVHEVAFGSSPKDEEQYADLVTEMYAQADEVLSVTRIEQPPLLLKRDLTERKYGYVTKGDRDVKKLEKKDKFKARTKGQSPDDGDGAVLALAPERLFKMPERTDRAAQAGAALTVQSVASSPPEGGDDYIELYSWA